MPTDSKGLARYRVDIIKHYQRESTLVGLERARTHRSSMAAIQGIRMARRCARPRAVRFLGYAAALE